MHAQDTATLEVDTRLLDQAGEVDRAVLTAMLNHRRGQIQVKELGDVMRVIDLVVRLWPKARVLMACTGPRAELIHHSMTRAGMKVGLRTGKGKRRGWRYLICSFDQATAIEPGRYDVLLLPHLDEADNEDTRAASRVVQARL